MGVSSISQDSQGRIRDWATGMACGMLGREGGMRFGFLLGALILGAGSPGEWTFLYEKAGFKAYEQKGHPVAYKAEGTVPLSLAEVAAVLVDTPCHREWVNRLAESRVLQGDPMTHCVMYSRYSLPWPAADRDAVVESVVEEDVARGEVRVRFWNTSSPLAPANTGCIRVPLSEGSFLLRDDGKGPLFVSYTIRLDPGGWLPNWIVRVFVRDAPYSTLRAFQAQILRTRGQYDAFIAAQKARWAAASKAKASSAQVDAKAP